MQYAVKSSEVSAPLAPK